jgi:uroporphyrinogen-III synthase
MIALNGCRVLITRAAEDAGAWASRLEALGARPLMMPCVRHEPVDEPGAATSLDLALRGADWLLLFSAKGAEAVARLARNSIPDLLRIAAVGPSTAAAAARHLRAPDFVSRGPTSVALARELLPWLNDPSRSHSPVVVVAGAADGRIDADAVLESAGVTVRRVPVYRTVAASPGGRKRDLAKEGIDVVLLASPSAVTGFINRVKLPVAAQIITIGPTTSAAAMTAGLRVSAEAQRPNLDGMLEAM